MHHSKPAIVASDMHSTLRRPCNMKKAYDKVKKINSNYLDLLFYDI